jgi:hypothetical protein
VPAAPAGKATKSTKHTKITKKTSLAFLDCVAAIGHRDKVVFFVAFACVVSFVVSRPSGLQ